MAFRRPLYYTGGNLREMSDSQIADHRTQMFYEYVNNPSVSLEVVGSGGNLGEVQRDWYQYAGAAASSATNYPNLYQTATPSWTYDSYQTLSQNLDVEAAPNDTNSIAYPVYYNSDGNLCAMTLQDMYDTFAFPTIDTLIGTNEVYRVSQSSSISGYTRLSGIVHVDTRANLSAYTASGIPESTSQFSTISSTYLFRRDASSVSYGIVPVKVSSRTSVGFQQYTEASYSTMFRNIIRYVARYRSGYKIRYGINFTAAYGESWTFSGNNCGGITDTVYLSNTGYGNYQTRFVNADDYRAQQFPAGTLYSFTSYLRVRKE